MPTPVGRAPLISRPSRIPDFASERPHASEQPGTREDRYNLWQPAKGQDTSKPSIQIGPEFASYIKNFETKRGRLILSRGLSEFGTGLNESLRLISDHKDSSGRYLVGVSLTKFWRYEDGVWSSSPLSVNLPNFEIPTATSYGGLWVLASSANKLQKFDPIVGFTLSNLSADAPAAFYVMNFGNRVVALKTIDAGGNIEFFRLQWSVANTGTDWTGLGSGNESLVSGDRVDQIQGGFPLTEEVAVILRENSIHHLVKTGIGLTPFAFQKANVTGIGTLCPASAVLTPLGLIFLSEDDFMLYTLNGINTIGEQVRNEVLDNLTQHELAQGSYDRPRQQYKFYHPDLNCNYVFNLVEQTWTKEVLSVTPTAMALVTDPVSGGTIDELVGTIDSLSGSIDDLSGAESVSRLMLYAYANGVKKADTTVFPACEIWTPELSSEDPEFDVSINSVKLLYKSNTQQNLVIEYSFDGGISWSDYGTFLMKQTVKPLWAVITKNIHGFAPTFRIKSAAPIGAFEILTLVPHVVEGETNAR